MSKSCKRLYPGLFLLGAATAALVFAAPQTCAEALRHGLALCGGSLLVSLFPFLVVSALIMRSGAGEVLGVLLWPVVRCIGLRSRSAGSVLLIGLVGVPVFSGYGAGIAKLAGPTGGYLVGYLLLAFIGGLFIEKSKGQPVVSGIGLVLGDAACYVLGTAWFVFQMQCELGYALSVCVYPFIALDLAKIVVSCVVGALLRKRLEQAGVLKLQSAVSE